MTAPPIRTLALTKRYGPVTAVEDLDLTVGRGEIYALLGRNGAGKTTTIRTILGMVRPTAGHAEIFGTRVGAEPPRLWARVGHLVEEATAYPDLTTRDNLQVARRLQGVRDADAVDRVIDWLGLGEYADRKAAALSTGNLQRLALARALLHDPDLLILDEPTTGLDPAGVVEIRELLRRLARERGMAILLSSHFLTEVERVATRIAVLHRGRLIAEMDAAEWDRQRGARLEVGARNLERAAELLREAGFEPDLDPGTVGRSRPTERLIVVRDPEAVDQPDAVAGLLVRGGAPPTRIAVARDDMEAFFLSLTGEAEA